MSLLAQYGEGARVLAGGQDLLFRIKKYIVKPECVVNIKTIPGLSYVHFNPEENLRIGALTTLSQVAHSSELQQRYSVLAEAAGVVASRRSAIWGPWPGTSVKMSGAGICRTDSPVGNPVASSATWQAATVATTGASWAATFSRIIRRIRRRAGSPGRSSSCGFTAWETGNRDH